MAPIALRCAPCRQPYSEYQRLLSKSKRNWWSRTKPGGACVECPLEKTARVKHEAARQALDASCIGTIAHNVQSAVDLTATTSPGAAKEYSFPAFPQLTFQWQASFACGDPMIDKARERIFSVVCDFLKSLQNDLSSSAAVITKAAAILHLVRASFMQEESILFQSNRPHFLTHQKMHKDLLAEISASIGQAAKGQASIKSIGDLLLNRLLFDHIIIADNGQVLS